MIGGTVVYAGVKFELRTPLARPTNAGFPHVRCRTAPRGRQKIRARPSIARIDRDLSRVVDRGIRESGCIDMESLCIVPGEKVLGVMIDIHVLSDQGNIFDACGLAAIAALRTAVVPAERFDVGEDHTLQKSMGRPSWRRLLVLAADLFSMPTSKKKGGDERIHITLGDEGHLHSLQKGLKGVFTPAEFAEIFDVAQKRCGTTKTRGRKGGELIGKANPVKLAQLHDLEHATVSPFDEMQAQPWLSGPENTPVLFVSTKRLSASRSAFGRARSAATRLPVVHGNLSPEPPMPTTAFSADPLTVRPPQTWHSLRRKLP